MSTGRKSSEFIRATQTNTVSASGAMKLRSPWTMAFDWFSTISTSISTAAWKRPGTPEVARRAAIHMIRQPSDAHGKIDQNMVSIVDDGEVDHDSLVLVRQVAQVVLDVF